MMEFAPPAYPSASPGFSFASPSGSFRRTIASSPTGSAATYGAPSFLDTASPLLPRRSPRLNSRMLSSFSPSPSIFNRTLSAYSPSPTPSSKRLRGEPLYDLSSSLPDDAWESQLQRQPLSPTASSQSTPIPSTGQHRTELETRASSDRASDRSLRPKRQREDEETDGGDGDSGESEQRDSSVDGSYPEEQGDMQRESSAMSMASTASKQHARLSQLQQQLLRAASDGEAPQPSVKRAKKEERSEDDEEEKTVEDDTSVAERDDHWPHSSSSSATSSSSFPSLSSLSTTFNTPESRSQSPTVMSPVSPVSVSSSLSSPSRVDRSGESCHQCKTRRLPSDLIYCSARHLKKGRARKKKKERLCRKKYCARCLHKFYNEPPPQVTGPDGGWICPGCRGMCSCAACKRHKIKRELRERKLALKGSKRRRGGVEKASEAKVVRAAGVDGNTAMAAPVTAVAATGAGRAVPVSVAIPADSNGPSMAINIDSAASVTANAMAPPPPMQPYTHTRRSPRLSQRALPPSADVVSLGPMQSAGGYPSSSSPSHLSSYSSPGSYPPSSFNFIASDAHSPSYYPSHPSFSSFQASPLLPPHLLLPSPSHSTMSSPYGGSSSSSGVGSGGYAFGVNSPLMSPGPQLYRRSPRLTGRLLSENGNEWNRPYGY